MSAPILSPSQSLPFHRVQDGTLYPRSFSMTSSGCLLRQLRSKLLILLRNIALISRRIDKWIGRSCLLLVQLLQHVEVDSMSAQKHIAGQRLQSPERQLKVLRHVWIRGIPNQLVGRENVGAPDDNDVVDVPTIAHLHSPR